MFDGTNQTLNLETRRLSVTRFSDVTYDLSALTTSDFGLRKSIDELSTAELLIASPVVASEIGLSPEQLRQEGHSRIAQPMLAVATSLIGFAALLLGGFSRFGLWRQIGIAIGLLIFVQLVNTQGTALALSSPYAWVFVYLGPLTGLGIAGALLWLSQRPRRSPSKTQLSGGQT